MFEGDDLLADDNVVVAIKNNSFIEWYQADREIWVLDRQKWHNSFLEIGMDCPEDSADDRFGILIVNDDTKDKFLENLLPFKVDSKKLDGFREKIKKSSSIWDSAELFPMAFIDFDSKKLSACYPYAEKTPVEKYVPDGWSGEFVDFMRKFDEDILPKKEKYWIINGIDYLEKLSSLL
ncbi:hypothetical protein [Xenorhabdus doucetiae]|uniref:Group-specific protein n=1 Tax=Xenorhabdus doucetiae TaxID=351671 RepID=A0A068QZY0_9GAMM|nr:hypothetical protein [Xenorhabdus doucetiae]TYP05857.1 hypothetical protein LY16_02002 [Xenorhabdus doucetiae]CDG19385.1 conserved protein of unknown function [Xenorhabdus doucetiae]